MEFQIDFIDNAGHDQTMVVEAPNVIVAEDMVYTDNPNAEIMYVTSEADYELFNHDEPDESMDGDQNFGGGYLADDFDEGYLSDPYEGDE